MCLLTSLIYYMSVDDRGCDVNWHVQVIEEIKSDMGHWLRSLHRLCMPISRAIQELLVLYRRLWQVKPGLRMLAPIWALARYEEFMDVCQRINMVELADEATDTVRWVWEQDGQFSVQSGYAAKFVGKEVAPTEEFTWSQGHLFNVDFRLACP